MGTEYGNHKKVTLMLENGLILKLTGTVCTNGRMEIDMKANGKTA